MIKLVDTTVTPNIVAYVGHGIQVNPDKGVFGSIGDATKWISIEKKRVGILAREKLRPNVPTEI